MALRIRENAPYIIVLGVFVAIFLPVLLTENQVFLPSAGDQPVGFFPVESGLSIFSAWSTQNLGVPIQHSFGVALFLLAQLFTGSAFAAQLMTYCFLLLLGSVGIIFAFRRLGLITNGLVLVPLALAYSLNWNLFDTLQLLQIGYTASVPFIFLYGVRLLNGLGKTRFGVLGLTIGLLVATLFANVGGFGNALFILIPIALASLLQLRVTKSIVRFLRGTIAVGVAIILATVVGLPFFYQGYELVLGGGFHHYLAVTSGGSLTSSTPLSRLFYLPTLMPDKISPFLVGSSPTLSDSFWPLSMSAVALGSIALLGRNGLRKNLALGFMLTLLALLAMIQLILAQSPVVNLLYREIPLLFVLIEAQNYLYTITPLWFILAALGISALEDHAAARAPRGKKILKLVAIVLSIMTLTSSISAFGFQPLQFNSLYQNPISPAYPDFPPQPPQQIVMLFQEIQANRTIQGPFRVLWLPYPLWLAQMFYSTGTPDILNLLTIGNQTVFDSVYAALSTILDANTSNFGASIAPFGFKYIVVPTFFSDNDSISFESVGSSPVQISGNPALFIKFISLQRDIRLIKQDSAYSLYENMAIPVNSSGVFWASDSDAKLPLVGSLNTPPGLAQIKSMTPPYSPSGYVVSVDLQRPAWLVFDQTYNSGWTARIVGQERPLNHSDALGWANAFFIPHAGKFLVNVSYSPQGQLDLAWTISAMLISAIISVGVISILTERRRMSENQPGTSET